MVVRYDYEGRLHFKTGNIEKAIESYEELLQLNAGNLETYYKLIEVKGVTLPKNASEILGEVD